MKREKIVQKQEPHMPAVVEARSMLCAVPLDVSRGESRGVWLSRVARLLGLTSAKAKRIYYGEVKRIDADEFARMRSRLEELHDRATETRGRINDLIYRSHEIERDARVARTSGGVPDANGQRAGRSNEDRGGVGQSPRATTAGG